MKKILSYSIAAILCLIFSTSCKAQKLFNELAAIPGVESTYVGPAMTGSDMARSIVGNGDLGLLPQGMIEEIKAIEIITADNGKKKPLDTVKTTARHILEQLKAEIMMETTDDEDATIIYGIPSAKGKDAGYTDIILVNYDNSDFNLIHIAGKIKHITGKIKMPKN